MTSGTTLLASCKCIGRLPFDQEKRLNKKWHIIFKLSIYVILFIGFRHANAQRKISYAIGNNYSVTITGNSNLHDWKETVQKASGYSIIIQNTNGSFNIDSLFIRMDVHSISSTEGKTMVNKTHDALKGDRYPFITFSILSSLNMLTADKNGKNVTALGELTIAGVTRRINIAGKIYAGNPNQFIFEGLLPVKLSDYNILPPTAMLGLLKVKDLITVHYRTCFEKRG